MRAEVADGINVNAKIAALQEEIDALLTQGDRADAASLVRARFVGDLEEQQESQEPFSVKPSSARSA